MMASSEVDVMELDIEKQYTLIVNEIQKLVKLELNLCRYEHDIKLEKVD